MGPDNLSPGHNTTIGWMYWRAVKRRRSKVNALASFDAAHGRALRSSLSFSRPSVNHRHDGKLT
jgi:hypothetical protein